MWLFTPKDMNYAASAYAPASADWISAFTSLSPDIELFVLSSETHSPRPFSWRGWLTRPWLRRLSGMTSAPSTDDRGAAAFISSLPVIPASRSRTAGCGGRQTIPVTSGPRLPVSSAKCGPNGASLKTCSAISPLVSMTSSETFKAWATALRRASNQRLKAARLTSANGSSFWPTPTMMSSGNRAAIMAGPDGLKFQPDKNQTGTQVGLRNAASAWTLLTSILTATDWKGDSFLSSLPGRIVLLNGETTSTDAQSLNPRFTDWMMGWPLGWSDPQRPVTEFALWLRRARGCI